MSAGAVIFGEHPVVGTDPGHAPDPGGRPALDDPYDDAGFVAVLAGGDATVRPVRVACGDGALTLLLSWTPAAGGWLVRSADYAVVHLHGSIGPADLAAGRAALDRALAAEGAHSEVVLLGPLGWHHDGAGARLLDAGEQAALAAAFGAVPQKRIAVAGWHDDGPTLDALEAKVRNDVRTGLRAPHRLDRFDGAAVPRFAERYARAMARKDAADRWRLGTEHFARLAVLGEHAGPNGTELFVVEVGDDDDGAAALFARAGTGATYLYATRHGDLRGGPAAVLWHAYAALHERGVRRVMLGGGVGGTEDDSLWRFKRRLGRQQRWLHLAARLYDADGHAAAVADGRARPLPDGALARPGGCAGDTVRPAA